MRKNLSNKQIIRVHWIKYVYEKKIFFLKQHECQILL